MATQESGVVETLSPTSGWVGAPDNTTLQGVLREGARGVTTITNADSPYTLQDGDGILLCDTTAGAITVNLPATADHVGRVLTIKKTDVAANAVTLDGNGAETIDGSATNAEVNAQYDVLTVAFGPTGLHVLSKIIAP